MHLTRQRERACEHRSRSPRESGCEFANRSHAPRGTEGPTPSGSEALTPFLTPVNSSQDPVPRFQGFDILGYPRRGQDASEVRTAPTVLVVRGHLHNSFCDPSRSKTSPPTGIRFDWLHTSSVFSPTAHAMRHGSFARSRRFLELTRKRWQCSRRPTSGWTTPCGLIPGHHPRH